MKNYWSLLSVLIVAVMSLAAMATYMQNNLGGNINFHFMPAEKWGTPVELAAKGIKPLYFGANQAGWDGQFYYYMSNDLLGIKDTPQHIDSPSYRYQRVGLSLYAAAVAFVTGQSWVSPAMYYLSYLAVVLAAVWAAGRIAVIHNVWPLAGLLWALGPGTQVTLLNGLPDAAADAFLILATLAIFHSRVWFGAIMLSMAVLSREAYIIFPVAYLGLLLWTHNNKKLFMGWVASLTQMLRKTELAPLLLPIGVFVLWQFYVRYHFGVSPTSQAHNILGFPFYEWWIALKAGLSGRHYLVPPGLPSYAEAIAQICFMLLLIMTVALATKVLARHNYQSQWTSALAVGGVVLVSLYISFGHTVAMHYTGYMKAANIFLFLIPLFISESGISLRLRYFGYVLLVIIVAVTSVYFWRDRVLPKTYTYAPYVRSLEVTRTEEAECITNFNVLIKLTGIEDISSVGVLSKLLAANHAQVFWIDLTNLSGQPFIALHGKGSVNMSYHWLAMDGQTLVKDGIRSMIPDGIVSGATARVPVVVEFPSMAGNYILRFAPVQEGCAWFYMANHDSKMDLLFVVK